MKINKLFASGLGCMFGGIWTFGFVTHITGSGSLMIASLATAAVLVIMGVKLVQKSNIFK